MKKASSDDISYRKLILAKVSSQSMQNEKPNMLHKCALCHRILT